MDHGERAAEPAGGILPPAPLVEENYLLHRRRKFAILT